MKVIYVYSCNGCPYLSGIYCLKTRTNNGFLRVVPAQIRTKNEIPEWCPLQEKGDDENGK